MLVNHNDSIPTKYYIDCSDGTDVYVDINLDKTFPLYEIDGISRSTMLSFRQGRVYNSGSSGSRLTYIMRGVPSVGLFKESVGLYATKPVCAQNTSYLFDDVQVKSIKDIDNLYSPLNIYSVLSGFSIFTWLDGITSDFNIYLNTIDMSSIKKIDSADQYACANDVLDEIKTDKQISDITSTVGAHQSFKDLEIAVPFDWNNKRVVFYGTSITYYCMPGKSNGAKYPNHADDGYPALIADGLNLNFDASTDVSGLSGAAMADSNNTTNYGSIWRAITGTTKSSSLNNGYGTGFHIDLSGVDVVCIECCTNDFKLGVPVGTVSTANIDTKTFVGALNKSIQYIQSQYPDCEIMLISDTHRNNGEYDSENTINGAGSRFKEYVNAMSVLAGEYNIWFCDWFKNSGITLGNVSSYTVDGLHLNSKGYSNVADCSIEYMRTLTVTK